MNPLTREPLARASDQRGFTLAETMVAVAVLALIGALTFGTFARAMQARDRATEITDRYHQIRQGMLRDLWKPQGRPMQVQRDAIGSLKHFEVFE